jgi:hypothetical protein
VSFWREVLVAMAGPQNREIAVRGRQVELELARDDALDALESMVGQYLYDPTNTDTYDHMFMSAGEEACDVLARLRPDKWQQIPTGLRRRR